MSKFFISMDVSGECVKEHIKSRLASFDQQLLSNLTPIYMDIYCRLLAGETLEIRVKKFEDSLLLARTRRLSSKYMEVLYDRDGEPNTNWEHSCFHDESNSLIRNVSNMQQHDFNLGLTIENYFTQKKVG